MIIFFGPAGAGKSVQGQILAARHGWRWLSAGQLLRDSRDPELTEKMRRGELVETSRANDVIKEALQRAQAAAEVNKVILDGFPRELAQAEWLIPIAKELNMPIHLAIVLNVAKEELLKRLSVRGRPDDTPDAIEERLDIYRREVHPILEFLKGEGIPVAEVDGDGSVGQVHDRVEAEIEACLPK